MLTNLRHDIYLWVMNRFAGRNAYGDFNHNWLTVLFFLLLHPKEIFSPYYDRANDCYHILGARYSSTFFLHLHRGIGGWMKSKGAGQYDLVQFVNHDWDRYRKHMEDAVQMAYNALDQLSENGFGDLETERRLYASTARNFMADAARQAGYDPLKHRRINNAA